MDSYLLSSEEKQKVPFIHLAHVDLDHSPDGRLQVVALWFRCVENLHGVGASRDGQQWATVKVHLELAGVECGAHHNDLGREGRERRLFRDYVVIKEVREKIKMRVKTAEFKWLWQLREGALKWRMS